MDTIAPAERLPADIDEQPVVQAAKALQPELRQYLPEIERDQRFPKALVERMRAAGFYRMVLPRSLGGLQLDPITYTRVAEILAEGAGPVKTPSDSRYNSPVEGQRQCWGPAGSSRVITGVGGEFGAG